MGIFILTSHGDFLFYRLKGSGHRLASAQLTAHEQVSVVWSTLEALKCRAP